MDDEFHSSRRDRLLRAMHICQEYNTYTPVPLDHTHDSSLSSSLAECIFETGISNQVEEDALSSTQIVVEELAIVLILGALRLISITLGP
jgi:hypothetical protein